MGHCVTHCTSPVRCFLCFIVFGFVWLCFILGGEVARVEGRGRGDERDWGEESIKSLKQSKNPGIYKKPQTLKCLRLK